MPFIYNASAVGFAAKILAISEYWASSALPVTGGVSSPSTAGPVQHTFFSFQSAEAETKGVVNAQGNFETTTRATVTGLNIMGKLLADKVEVIVTSVFDANPAKKKVIDVKVNQKPYVNLTIDGDDYSKVAFDGALAKKAGTNHTGFRGGLSPTKHQIDKLNRAHLTVANDKNQPSGKKLKSAKPDFGFVDKPWGRIYFAEWIEEEERQSVTGLRVVLNNPVGEIVIADPGWNGGFYP